ncbi:RNA recognition motif-containing protein [Colletotrichum tabaci]|uniref:RNA recognition motif-containing protein n=1 Tax=Colletotrichum tabaci TaxID=1209068 RepID=A0AAV9T7H4_9PEZI
MADWPLALTSIGDVHYFYGPPTNNPPHHRFDKGSYIYLFENATDRRARIEIANQPGTEDQDAFDGFLDKTHVRYSYNHHCLVTLIVGETTDQLEWHLPTYDPQNQNKYHYKLHSLDIYFWKAEDALQFVNGIRFVLPPSQVEILDEPQQQQHHHHHQVHQPAPVSSVVQQLEHVAISDPNYGSPNATSQTAPPSFPGPPPTSAVLSPEQQPQQPASFVPMAYNPAAPAAPEVIRHREKTPPPEDDIADPLAAAVAYDAQAPFSPGFVPPPGFQSAQGVGVSGAGLLPPPPPQQQQQHFGGPPAHPGLQRAATVPVQTLQSGLASPGLTNPYASPFPASPGFQPPPPPPLPQQQQTTPPPSTTPQTTQPVTSPGPTATPATVATPPVVPPGGFSQYSYTSSNGTATPQQQPGAFDYSIHAQAYRPTELEANKYKGYAGKQDPSGKLEQNMGRLEKGVTGMFRKFEKKFG